LTNWDRAIEQRQPRANHFLHRLNDRRKNLIGNDLAWLFGQTGLEAASPRNAQLGIDMDDVDPGGNGLAFDWQLLSGKSFRRPWLLSGGLDASNLAEAVRISGAPAVDVSSGVESAPGVKDLDRIRAFLAVARSL